MKKTAIALGSIIVLVFIAMPYFSGSAAETASRQMMENLNARSQEYGNTEIIQYERGMRSTQSKFKWTPPATFKLLSDPIEYSCEGTHGLLGYAYDCKIDHSEQYTDFINQHLAGEDPLKMHGNVSLSGQISQTLGVEKFHITGKQDSTVKIEQGEITVITDQSVSHIQANGHQDGIVIDGEDVAITFNKLALESDININQHKLGIGEASISLDKFDMDIENDKVLMEDIRVDVETSEQENNLNMDYRFTVDAMQTQFGENSLYKASDVQFDFSLAGLEMATFASLNEKMSNMLQDIAGTLTEKESIKLQQAQTLMAVLPDAEKLLKQGFGFKVAGQAKINGEEAQFSIDAKLTQRMTSTDFMAILYQQQQPFEKLAADIAIKLPNAILEQDAKLSERIAQNPLFEKTSDGYSLRLKLSKDDMQLNDKPISTQELTNLSMQTML